MKNKVHVSVLLIFVFTILVTVYTKTRIDEQKNINDNQDMVISLSNGWNENSVTDNKIMIYGSYYLSTNANSDIEHTYYCQTNDCEFITGNDNFALIKDNGYIIFSLFDNGVYYLSDFSYDFDNVQFLVNNGILYGLIYHEDGHDIYYSLDNNKYYFNEDNIEIDDNSKYVISKNELIIIKDNIYYLVDLSTMERIIDGTTIEISFYESENDYLILVNDYKDDIVNIYTSNLNSINLPIIKNVSLYNKHIILTGDNKSFVVKNFDNEIITISEDYDMIYDFINGYIIAGRDDNLLIVNISSEILKEIPLNGMEYDHIKSGFNNEDNSLYLYIGTDLDWKEIYFNIETYELYTRDV